MTNIKYFKFGLDRYLNNFQSDKNSGLYEYHLIREELVKIDSQVKNGTLVVLNGAMTEVEIEKVEKMIEDAHVKCAKAIYIVTDEIAFSNIDIMNKFDLVLHQAWNYNFDTIKVEQAYSYVPELFLTNRVEMPDIQHDLIFFCGNDNERCDKISQYLRRHGECMQNTFSLIKNKNVDERIEHNEYLKLQKMFKFSLMICRKSYRECGWITARLIEAIDCWSYPIFDIDYDINGAYKFEDVSGYDEMCQKMKDVCKSNYNMMCKLITMRTKAYDRKKLFKKQIIDFCKEK